MVGLALPINLSSVRTFLMRLASKPLLAIAASLLLAVGFAAGIATPWDDFGPALSPGESEEHAEHAGESHDGHNHGAAGEAADHVDLSPTARANLGLRTGRLRRSDFVRTLHIPGEIVEASGYSAADVPARVAGVVTRIHIAPGQAVKPGDPLFELDLTGEALAEAQSRLLDDLQQIATLQAELDRLGPLTDKGSVAAKQRLQLEYDLRRIEGQRHTRVQELLIRGLTPAQIDRIITDQELVKSVTVVVPEFPEGTDARPRATQVSAQAGSNADVWEYTVEAIHVHPGESVAPEKSLARLARHTQLYVRGHAFERDVPTVASIGIDDTVSVEIGGEGHDGIDGPVGNKHATHAHGEVIEGLKVLYLDNHVDPATQTYAFYVPLTNQVLRDVVDERGRVFRSWKFKPGQRVHIRLPIETLKDRIVLPATAVVTEGPSSFIFKLAGRHAVGSADVNGERQYEEEYVQIPVAVTYSNSESAVLADLPELREGDIIAMNRAYQLYLALKKAAEGGGGGHHHGHEH